MTQNRKRWDDRPDPDSDVCTTCGHRKPIGQFRPRHRQCRTCERAIASQSWQTREYKAAKRAYLRRPEVVERVRELNRENREARALANKAYRNTPIGRARQALVSARHRLKHSPNPASRERIRRTIDAWVATIARMEAKYRGVDGRKIRGMPTGFHERKGARP